MEVCHWKFPHYVSTNEKLRYFGKGEDNNFRENHSLQIEAKEAGEMATGRDPDYCVVNIFSKKTYQTDRETTGITYYYGQEENNNNSVNITQQTPEVFVISGNVQMQVETPAKVYKYLCPFCENEIDFEEKDTTSNIGISCHSCKRVWCIKCALPQHKGVSCSDYQTQIETAYGEYITLSEKEDIKWIMRECETCFELKNTWQTPCCNLNMCFMCFETYLVGKVDDGEIDIQCPGNSCNKLLHPFLIKKLINYDKSQRLSFLRIKADRYKNRKACPSCDFILTTEKSVVDYHDKYEAMAVCPRCFHEWCFHCMSPWHEGMTCGEYKGSQDNTGVKEWANSKGPSGKRNAQMCPNCNVSFPSFSQIYS